MKTRGVSADPPYAEGIKPVNGGEQIHVDVRTVRQPLCHLVLASSCVALGMRRAVFRSACLAGSLGWAASGLGCAAPTDVEACLQVRLATPPAPEPVYPTRPRLGVYLSLMERGATGDSTAKAPGLMNISGSLEPGYERLGRRDDCPDGYALRHRQVINDTLRVAGVTLAPVRVWSDGGRTYALDSALAPLLFASVVLTVAPPVVAGVAAFTTSPGWTGLARLDPDTVGIARGADLELHLSVPEEPPGTAHGQLTWRLELRGGTGAVSIAGDGRPPARLVVPGNLVRSDSNGLGIAELQTSEIGSAPSGSAEYTVFAGLFVRLRWVIRVLATSS